jgi:hypothetical protein
LRQKQVQDGAIQPSALVESPVWIVHVAQHRFPVGAQSLIRHLAVNGVRGVVELLFLVRRDAQKRSSISVWRAGGFAGHRNFSRALERHNG